MSDSTLDGSASVKIRRWRWMDAPLSCRNCKILRCGLVFIGRDCMDRVHPVSARSLHAVAKYECESSMHRDRIQISGSCTYLQTVS